MAWYWWMVLGVVLGAAARNRLEAFSLRRMASRLLRAAAGRKAVLALTAAAASLALVSCSPDLPPGPAGEVVARETKLSCRTIGSGTARSQSCRWKYWLTTQDGNSSGHRFRGNSSDYSHCKKGFAYPHCTQPASPSASTAGSR
ncbi:hypothetical protein [Streptomyces chartreusis]|uniref:hypothetical protein n=1 Tax=Streptomyces chartreusis TaxID=1969 RepID=UPI003816C53D